MTSPRRAMPTNSVQSCSSTRRNSICSRPRSPIPTPNTNTSSNGPLLTTRPGRCIEVHIKTGLAPPRTTASAGFLPRRASCNCKKPLRRTTPLGPPKSASWGRQARTEGALLPIFRARDETRTSRILLFGAVRVPVAQQKKECREHGGGMIIVIWPPHHSGFSASHWLSGTSVADGEHRTTTIRHPPSIPYDVMRSHCEESFARAKRK